MADIAPNSGALSLLGGALDNNEEPDPIALYQLQVQSPEIGGGQKLQDVYGTSSMPVFEWVKSIQTGERTYNPADSFDQQRAEEYRQLQQINPELPKIPGIGDIAKGLAAPIGGFVAVKIATAALHHSKNILIEKPLTTIYDNDIALLKLLMASVICPFSLKKVPRLRCA